MGFCLCGKVGKFYDSLVAHLFKLNYYLTMLNYYKLIINSKMHRYIALLLITGTVLAQNGLDTLVLKNGTKYLGKYLRIESKYGKSWFEYRPMVYFGPKNEESLRIIPVQDVERLQLKDGIFVINHFKINYNFLRSQMTTSEKAVIDAKKWTTYPLLAGLTFFSSMIGTSLIFEDGSWYRLPAIIGISTASLAITYIGLNNSYKNQIAKISSEDIEVYKETFSKELIKNNIKFFGLLGLAASGGIYIFESNFSLGSFGPSSNHCCF